MLAVVGAVGIFPFAIIRFAGGELLIGLLDSSLVIGLVSLALYLHKTHKVRVASIALALLAATGLVATNYMEGPTQVYWIYPVLVGIFFLLQRREALIISILAIIALVPILVGKFDVFAVTSILITIFVTGALAFAFATTTRNQQDDLMRLAIKDPLTGAGNRRALENKLGDIIASRSRSSTAIRLSLRRACARA